MPSEPIGKPSLGMQGEVATGSTSKVDVKPPEGMLGESVGV